MRDQNYTHDDTRATTRNAQHEATHELPHDDFTHQATRNDISRDERQTSRRAFTKTVAAAIVVAPLALRVSAQTPPKTAEPVAPPKPQPSPSPQTPPPPSPLALAYAEVARLRFGDHVSEEEMTRVKRSLQGKVRTADALRNVKLQNSDEPDFVFSA